MHQKQMFKTKLCVTPLNRNCSKMSNKCPNLFFLFYDITPGLGEATKRFFFTVICLLSDYKHDFFYTFYFYWLVFCKHESYIKPKKKL